jgi:hypothetical protein
MDLWSACLVLTNLHRHRHHPFLLQQHPAFRVSVISFYPWCFSLAGYLLPCFSPGKSCFSALYFLGKCVVRVALLFGPLAPGWLPRLLSHLSGSQTDPWPLVLRLLASAELLLYRTSLPHLIISRTIWSEWTWSRWSHWLAAGCPLSV